MRWLILFVWAVALGVLIAWSGLEVRTGLSALSVGGISEPEALEADLSMIVALAPDGESVTDEIVEKLAARLRSSHLVDAVDVGPAEPSEAFVSWLWTHRFELAPPQPSDLEVASMAARLQEARDAFDSAEGLLLGDYLLLDPTGSFSRVLTALEPPAGTLAVTNGIWRARDGKVAILFLTLADRPFQVRNTIALSDQIRNEAENEGVRAVLLGARTIAAETTQETTRASVMASLVALALLVVWLLQVFRSASVVLAFIPLVIGAGTAIALVQLVFGSIHVLVFGFGGALLGLALDYPMHMAGHAIGQRVHVGRLVLLGAGTTALAFLSMLGTGVPVLQQSGVFIATGLLAAAGAAIALPINVNGRLHVVPITMFRWRLPRKPFLEAGLIVCGAAVVATQSGPVQVAIFAPPASVQSEIEEMNVYLPLPSGQYALRVSGDDIADLVKNQRFLEPHLEAAVKAGQIVSFSMLSQVVQGEPAHLQSAEEFLARAETALKQIGFEPTFAKLQAAAYQEAQSAPTVGFSELKQFPELAPLVSRLAETSEGVEETVPLFMVDGVATPPNFADLPGVALIDRISPIQSMLAGIQTQLVGVILLGLLCAVAFLSVGLRDFWRAVAIARTPIAAISTTSAILVLAYGSVSIFHIVAMALILGIGVDYGLFVRERQVSAASDSKGKTVTLCAVSTMVAFVVLMTSDVQLLRQIGSAVVLGLSITIALTLAYSEEGFADEN